MSRTSFQDPAACAASDATRRRTRGLQRLAVLLTVASVASLFAAAGPAGAAMSQLDGEAFYDTARSVCGTTAPQGFEAFNEVDPLVLRGDLEGCLWTKANPVRTTPSGVYLETGEELFVGSYLGGEQGTFRTTYRFESKWILDVEIHGRCQHPIVEGSGTGGFEGVRGRLLFKDEPPTYFYRGHIDLS